MRPQRYPVDWFELIERQGFDRSLPGLYVWEISGAGRYVGRYSKISRPLKHYARIVYRLRNGLPYRPQNPDGFRRIHHALVAAIGERRPITLHLWSNCAQEDLANAERALIEELSPELNGREV